MASAQNEKVTVNRGYFEAILRRAGFHTSAQLLGRPDPTNVSISKVEYDSLLRTSREYDLLKNALFQGGITGETLDLLISGAENTEQRKDSSQSIDPWTDDFSNQRAVESRSTSYPSIAAPFREIPWRTVGAPTGFNPASGASSFQNSNPYPSQNNLRVPSLQRHVSYGLSSGLDDGAFDDEEGFVDEKDCMSQSVAGIPTSSDRRTLYLSGLSERTTYRDLCSVIKGGKILSMNLRPERCATVTLFEGAAEFLAWTKRNDIYLHQKRIEVKWADRQFHVKGHTSNKIANGATRNIIVQSALEKGLNEQQIRADIEHIHNLVIVDVVFRAGDAYVSTNSVHNALFARTCMMSRFSYRGCQIKFFKDECDVPLPARINIPKAEAPEPAKKKAPITNRFGMLNIDGSDGSSDAENRTPSDDGSETQTADMTSNIGVSLNFLDTDST